MIDITAAQISEFSLIIVAISVKMGYIPADILSLVILVEVIIIGVSTYIIIYTDKIYSVFSRYLGIFERKDW